MTRRRKKSTSGHRTAPIVKITAPAALIGVGTLAVSGVGIADAATGGNFILGKSNSESSTATLTNTNGTPLSLKAKAGSPPLAVNTNKLVKNLNANFLGGLSSSKFQRTVTGACKANGIRSISASGAAACALPSHLVFTASGSFTVPAGVTHITGDVWGAGGGSGYGADGGAGGAFEQVLLTVSPGDVIHVTVGTGGTGGGSGYGNRGTDGGASTLSINAGSTIVTANGGQGGIYPCGTAATLGGTAGFPSSPALGLQSHSGGDGGCGATGNAGFAGAGGGGSGAAGHDGLIILSINS